MLDQLKPRPGATRRRKRVGRGPGSGLGKTCGTGVKGQGTRAGSKIHAAFEGGQMPLVRRVPKRGFTNIFRKGTEIVNLGDLSVFGEGASIDAEALTKRGLIRGSGVAVKLLGEGDAPKGLTIKVNRASGSAVKKVEAAGGSVELIG
jgi:large subunit ribosomal protein L15